MFTDRPYRLTLWAAEVRQGRPGGGWWRESWAGGLSLSHLPAEWSSVSSWRPGPDRGDRVPDGGGFQQPVKEQVPLR